VFAFIIIFTMFFGGGLIPSYLLMRSLHLLNTRGAIIISGAVSAWNFILARSYLQANIPDELIEAAAIDGAGDLRILFDVVVPMSQPIIAVLILFYAVSHWNDYFTPLIYLQNKDLMPVQVVLRDIVVMMRMQEMMVDVAAQRANLTQVIKYSTIIVSTVPILLIYPFVQRYFVQGIMVGALKG
jgi:putative aldouronate transport system permease protein